VGLQGDARELSDILKNYPNFKLTVEGHSDERGSAEYNVALGAQRDDISRPILREALLLATVGLAIGVPAALALTQLVKNQLYGVAPTDPFEALGTSFRNLQALGLPA